MSHEAIENGRLDRRDGAADTGASPDAACVSADQHLLHEYLTTRSDDAFAKLVARHTAFVYSAALRQAGNRTAAEEITQAVFVILARKTATIRSERQLRGWLFRAVRYAAMDLHKVEARRFCREQEAARLESTRRCEEPASAWEQMAPLIDEALDSLSAKDRDAVLLRFFEKKSFREIGETFGGNENSARLRVVRALEKLRGFFQKRGIEVSAGVFSNALPDPSSQAAPRELANSVLDIVASGRCPATVAVFGRAILRRLWWRTWPLWVASVAAALLLAVVVMGLPWRDRVPLAAPPRATALAIDRAITYGTTDTFIAHVYFHNQSQEQLKPVFAAFIRAAVALRTKVRERFDAQPVRLQLWVWTVEQIFHGQPRGGDNGLPADQVTDDFFRPYRMVMTRAGSDWLWDFFAHLSPDEVTNLMKQLQAKTTLCEGITHQIEEGKITTAEQALALIRGDFQ